MISNDHDIPRLLKDIPEGYSLGIYRDNKYGVSKQTFIKGKSIKLFAEALGRKDIISLNYYITTNQGYLKPCEMPIEKVVSFLEKVEIVNE